MRTRFATIAQSVEQRIRNAQVVRSIRIGGSTSLVRCQSTASMGH